MTGTQGRTREQLRRSIGRNLIGHRLIVSKATSAGDETGSVDDTLFGGDDNYNGWWIVVKAGEIRRVSDYDSTDARLSWTRPLPEATPPPTPTSCGPRNTRRRSSMTTSIRPSARRWGISTSRSRTSRCRRVDGLSRFANTGGRRCNLGRCRSGYRLRRRPLSTRTPLFGGRCRRTSGESTRGTAS